METCAAEPTAIDDVGPSFTITEFCKLEKISLASFFKLKRLGLGPDVLIVPGTNIHRVTPASRKAWHLRMAELAQQEAAALERSRRVEHAARAGKAAAKSAAHHSNRGRRDRS